MPKMRKLRGLAKATADPASQQFILTLATEGGGSAEFTADLPAGEQVLAALAQLPHASRERHPAGKAQIVSAQDVRQCIVQRDPWADRVLLRLIDQDDIPYTFALPRAAAADIGNRLKTESAKTGPTGTA